MSNATGSVTFSANWDVGSLLGGVKSLQGALNALKLPSNLTADTVKEFEKLKDSLSKYKDLMKEGVTSKADLKNLDKLEKSINSSFTKILDSYKQLEGQPIYLEADATQIKQAQQEIDKLKQDISNAVSNMKLNMSGPGGKVDLGLDSLLQGMEKAVSRSSTLKSAMTDLRNSLQSGNFDQIGSQLDQIKNHAEGLKGSSANLLNTFKQMGIISFEKTAQELAKTDEGARLLEQAFTSIKNSLSGTKPEIDGLAQSLKTATEQKAQLEATGRDNYTNAIRERTSSVEQYKSAMEQGAAANREFAQSSLSATQQVEQLQQSTQYFFSLRNMLNLLKRGIDEAIQSVKELDAAMTETAVVTDYKVSDLWGMLPQYTQLANQLGATTQGAYETMTLYFQQGLDQQQAFEIGAETMKMARIAGLDYAETTDMMTAALRGFNMELNETSAKRINDVYSELAAITASDTEELGTAMQRTASIAHSAGMSFEGTTAFLAQAIETTREPAENIGTAMKTIVARFQEMKENPLEISEVDGEEVDYNKVDAALQSIGVSLKDTNGQFRELDQVFLDISSRWDSLSQTQQRYIATVAAGSRQQSRFIAMMDNYDRTMQLFEAANNSAGASDEQFGKTMDSLESKLNKLHNAWQQFTMGIANNSMIKLAVDGMTSLLTITNKLIDAFSLGFGPLKSFLSVFTAFTGLKAMGRIANSLIGGLGGLVDPTSSFKQGLFRGATGARASANMAQAKAISNPIVAAINSQTVALGGTLKSNASSLNQGPSAQGYKNYTTAQQDFRKQVANNGTIGNTLKTLNNLDIAQQKALLASQRGSIQALDRGVSEWLSSKSYTKESANFGKQLMSNIGKGMAEGKISSKDASKILQMDDVVKSAKAAGPEAAQAYAKAVKAELDNNQTSIYGRAEELWHLNGTTDPNYSLSQAVTEARKEHIANWKQSLQSEDLNDALVPALTSSEKLSNAMSGLGSGVTATGQAFSSFGAILSNLGLDGVGAAFVSLGTTITNLGMTVSSLGMVLPKALAKVKAAGGVLKAIKAESEAAGLAGAMGGLGAIAGIGAIALATIAIVKKSEENAREAAKKIQEDFTSTAEEIDNKLSDLESNKDRFSKLSEGIDEYGRNIGLTNDEYGEYLTLSRSIADVAPELIAGYDAQGNAMIAQGDAIDELIAKQKELQKQNIQTYTTNSSFETNIKGIRATDAFKGIQSYGYSADSSGLTAFNKQIQNLRSGITQAGISIEDVQNIISKTTGQEINLLQPSLQDIQLIGTHYNDLVKAIEAENPRLSEAAREGLEDAFSTFSSDWNDIKGELSPLTDQIKQYLSLQEMDALGMGLSGDFVVAFNEGLENISLQAAINNWDGNEIKRAANDYATAFNRVAGEGSEYQQELEKVEQAQQDYLDTIEDPSAFDTYKSALQSSADAIKEYAEGVRDGTEAGEALYNMLMSSAAKIENSATQPIMSIGEALNTLTDDIEEARGAYERFSEATKDKDFSTAAEGMSKILEEGLDEKHIAGFGDNTFWTAARETLDPETLKGDKKAVEKAMKDLQPALQGGLDGYTAFYNKVKNLSADTREELHGLGVEFENGTEGMITKIPENAFSAVAESLHASDQALTAMLNNAQQFAEIDFSNYAALKESLSQDDRAITGSKGKMGISEDTLVAEIRSANPNWDDNRISAELETFRKEGIITIPSKDKTQAEGFDTKQFQKDLKSLNISNQKELVDKLGATGTFNKQDLLALSQAAYGKNFNEEQFNDDYKEMTDNLENPQLGETNSTLHSIDANVAALAQKETQDNLKSGNALGSDFDQVKALRDKVYGKEGEMDTVYQKFSKGENVNGEKLTKDEFNAGLREIADARIVARETSASLREGLKNAELQHGKDSTEAEDYRHQLAANENLLKNLKTFEEQGRAAYAENGDASAVRNNTDYQMLVAAGWGEIFKSIPPQSLNTPEAQQAVQQAYSTLASTSLLNSTQMQAQTDEVKGQVQQAFDTLGIDIADAAKLGLINWKPEDIATAVEEKATETATQANEAGKKANDELNSGGDYTGLKMMKVPDWVTNLVQAGANAIDQLNQGPSEQITAPKPAIPAAEAITSGMAAVQKVAFEVTGKEEAEGALDSVKAKADEGADMEVKATQDGSLNNAQSALDKLKGSAASGATIKTSSTKAQVSGTGDVKQLDSALKGLPQNKNIPVKANVSGASDVSHLKSSLNSLPSTKTITVSIKTSGSVPHVYTGQNNKIGYTHVPQAGSLAKGTKKGRVGPRGQGGPTLTGELGYEVAWLPNEGRSMILGANGPQMVDLPSNAVVWNHEQSKEIMKRKGIPFGSAGGSVNATWIDPSTYTSSSATKSSKKSSKTSSKKSKSSKKGDSSAPNNWSIEEVVRFDIDKKLETLASKIKKATDDIDKKLDKIGLKASGIAKDTQAQVKNLQAVKNYNNNLVASYTKDLDKLRGGPYNIKISYDTGSGKKSKSKEETVNLASYIYRDGNGDYQIDRNAIAKAGSVAKQEAIFKAAESALNPLVSGLQKAKDAAADAQKQMDELGKKVSETFYQWENEITEVYNLTQRISHDESLRARFSSQVALQLSKLKAGFGDTAQSINIMHQALERDNKVLLEQIENQQKMIGARQRELNTALSAQDELDELNRLRAKSYDITATKDATIAWATNNYEGARLGRSYLNNVRQDRDGSLRYDIDWERFEKDRQANPYNKDTYEAIKKYLDELNSATDEFNKSIQEQTDLIKETYDALREYQDYVADFEDTLLKGFEEEIKNNIENSKKISESISNTLKDLLDQVKRKLDERRQQEDNRKTEDDISRKQQRLAMLRADTSGGHAAEIAQLESEIADSQQSYQRTLEDQLLDKLQQQGDEAAKQRERQIEIAQAQLEVATNGNSAIVDLWLRDPEAYKEEIKKAWLEAQGYDEKGEAGQYILANQFESEFANLVTAIDQSGFSNGFKAVSDDTNTLVSLLTQLTEGRDALTDSLSKAVGALQDVENRDTQSFEQSKRAQMSAAEWKKEGQTASSLKAWNYTFDELKKSGFTNAELRQAGFGIKDFITGGITNAKDLKASGFTAANLKNEGYTLKDLLDASFSGTELKNAGFGAKEFKQNEVAYNIAKAAGFDLKTLSSAGYSEATAELKKQADAAAKKAAAAAAAAKKKTQATNTYNSTLKAAHKSKTVTASQLKALFSAGDVLKYSRVKVMDDLASGDGSGGVTWKKVLQAAKQAGYSGKAIKSYLNGHLTPTRQKAFESVYGKWSKFATGGLANYTGPAWLDGTPSKPELVLNATDTKNFIALKDVLAHAIGSTGQINNSYGGNATYEININVDHLNNDYDVDKVVERVKKKIVQDAGYRNVTQVRKFR